MKRNRASSQTSKRSKLVAYAKRKPFPGQTFRIPRWAGKNQTGFPKQLTIKHRYVDRTTIACTAGAFANYKFRCNGMFDPNHSGTGHQPMYFDQLAALYNHYTVTKSKIKVSFGNLDLTGATVGVGIYIDDDTSSIPTTFESSMEQSSATFTTVGGATSEPRSITKYWNAVQAFGPNPMANDNLQGNGTTDPTEQQIFVLCCQPIQTASSTVNIGVLVEIEYTATWDELVNNNGS